MAVLAFAAKNTTPITAQTFPYFPTVRVDKRCSFCQEMFQGQKGDGRFACYKQWCSEQYEASQREMRERLEIY